MVTIEVGVGKTKKLELPRTWIEAAQRLGVTKQSLTKSRQVLEMMSDPLTPQTYELLRQITEFCARRDTGGGGKCTRREFVRLSLAGQLDERLKMLNIIGEADHDYD